MKIYWITTALFCAAMTLGGVADVMHVEDVATVIESLGYPAYLMTILGVAKLAGVVALLVPGFARVKEWAYAGFAIDLIGAAVSHAAVGHETKDIVVPIGVFVLMTVSYVSRPKSRKL